MIRRALVLLGIAVALISTASAVAQRATGTAVKPTQGRENLFPTWSPDGTRIAFVSGRLASANRDVWVIQADGTGLVNLTRDALDEGPPSWSPDGRRLAFTSAPIVPGAKSSVEIIDADGNGRRVLAGGSAPAWSPDGTRIAYSGDDGVHVLELMSSQGRLVAPAGSRPSWAPDARKIVYVRDNDVWVVDADGAEPQRLTSFTAARFAIAPTWSPDGSMIAFVVLGPTTAPEPNDVWTVGHDGTGLRLVMSAPFVDGAAEWAPDGRSLVFAAAERRNHDVEIYRAAMPDGTVLNLTNDRAWNQMPRFAPDGARLAFVIRHGGGYLLSDVWTLDLGTRKRRNLTGTVSGEAIDARAVRPPNRLTLARVAAWLDRSFPRPILRVEVRVSDKTHDEVGGAVVSIIPRLLGLEPLSARVPVTDGHGDTQGAFRVRRPGAVRVGSRIRVSVSARPRRPYARRVVVSRELRLLVAARPPLG